MKKIVTHLLLATSLALTGCQSGNVMDLNSVQSIQRNVTTEQQVRMMFGEPAAVSVNAQSGTKTLTYLYNNNDHLKKTATGILGAVAGGVLGHQIGGGSGQSLATGVGAVAGGALAENATVTREDNRRLDVMVSLATGVVLDYRYSEDKSRTQPWRPSSGPAAL